MPQLRSKAYDGSEGRSVRGVVETLPLQEGKQLHDISSVLLLYGGISPSSNPNVRLTQFFEYRRRATTKSINE